MVLSAIACHNHNSKPSHLRAAPPKHKHAVKRVDVRPECNREGPALLATASFLLFLSYVLPFIGGVVEAAHPASPLTDGAGLEAIFVPGLLQDCEGSKSVARQPVRQCDSQTSIGDAAETQAEMLRSKTSSTQRD